MDNIFENLISKREEHIQAQQINKQKLEREKPSPFKSQPSIKKPKCTLALQKEIFLQI